MSKKKRKVELVVISDVHLGTYGCHAKELLRYFKSIKPDRLILNGDIIDIWQFKKRYFPKSHMQIVKQLTSLMAKGVQIDYVTGNHDEMLRKFDGFSVGELNIVNKVIVPLEGKEAWIFHGDVFDVTMKHSKWLAMLGGVGYDMLILLNRSINFLAERFGGQRISLSKRIKDGVKSAVKFINDFEQVVADIAISNGYDYVVCGHIHQPVIKEMRNQDGKVLYLNSGDWVENLTALEYNKGEWKIYKYQEDEHAQSLDWEEQNDAAMKNGQLFNKLIAEFNILQEA